MFLGVMQQKIKLNRDSFFFIALVAKPTFLNRRTQIHKMDFQVCL